MVSWVTSILALAIGLSGVADTLKRGGFNALANRASFNLAPIGGTAAKFNLAEGMALYGPLLGAILFKKLTAELARTARIQTLIPRLG